MEKPTEIEGKYQKLATEFSKVRSQATVLKKAVLDEQAKNAQLNELLKIQEQTIRKHGQEMDSLIFRNDQLTKRISVLQQDLQVNNHGKKGSKKGGDSSGHSSNFDVMDEELHKKILENAKLASCMADKENELSEFKEKIEWLEEQISSLRKKQRESEDEHKHELNRLKANKGQTDFPTNSNNLTTNKQLHNCDKINELKHWMDEVERYKVECELLRAKPSSNEPLTEYYENQISKILEEKLLAKSEAKSLWAENKSLTKRLENLTLEYNQVSDNLQRSLEELVTTSENYKQQLDAMTEHLASQNERITKQCDEIQLLKHLLSNKK